MAPHGFLQVFYMHVLSVLSAFGHKLQVLHLNVSKVDQVLHLPFSHSDASPQCLLLLPAPAGRLLPPPLLTDAGDIRDGAASRGHVKRHTKLFAGAGVWMPHPSGH
jgi:hypothetical protein